MTRPRRLRLRLVAPVGALVLVATALAACQPVKSVSGSCSQYWRGYVLASDHNYAGIGAYPGSDRYMCKETPTQGVRAQIQHLRNYADPTSTPYNLGKPFEPRVGYTEANFTSFVYHGDAPRWIDLEGRWAVPGTTYADNIFNIYNQMRAYNGVGTLSPAQVDSTKIMRASELSAGQIAAFVQHTNARFGNTWRPEITPTQMAQLYLDEGNAAGVAGDIAFCQSIIETGWFSWPGSYANGDVGAADATDAPYFELRDGTTFRN
ncbi:MAG TPA: hypothetical protein VF152_02115 [Acidimicrobiia bacterium]